MYMCRYVCICMYVYVYIYIYIYIYITNIYMATSINLSNNELKEMGENFCPNRVEPCFTRVLPVFSSRFAIYQFV